MANIDYLSEHFQMKNVPRMLLRMRQAIVAYIFLFSILEFSTQILQFIPMRVSDTNWLQSTSSVNDWISIGM